MDAERTARIRVPARAQRGETVQVRCMLMHPMENGYRSDSRGTHFPVHLAHSLVCRYNGEEVFRADFGTGMAANPYLAFHLVAQATGDVEFVWQDDDGSTVRAQARIEVE